MRRCCGPARRCLRERLTARRRRPTAPRARTKAGLSRGYGPWLSSISRPYSKKRTSRCCRPSTNTSRARCTRVQVWRWRPSSSGERPRALPGAPNVATASSLRARAAADQLGWITSSRAVCQALASGLGGYLGHTFNRVYVIAFGCLIWGCTTLLFSFTSNVGWGAFTWAWNGIGLSFVIPNTQSLVADYYSDENRGTAFGALYTTGASRGAFRPAERPRARLALLGLRTCGACRARRPPTAFPPLPPPPTKIRPGIPLATAQVLSAACWAPRTPPTWRATACLASRAGDLRSAPSRPSPC